jgi:hypothetical protein
MSTLVIVVTTPAAHTVSRTETGYCASIDRREHGCDRTEHETFERALAVAMGDELCPDPTTDVCWEQLTDAERQHVCDFVGAPIDSVYRRAVTAADRQAVAEIADRMGLPALIRLVGSLCQHRVEDLDLATQINSDLLGIALCVEQTTVA